MTRIIVITGWDRFQHYKDRDPPWVKLYRDILTSESWLLGTDASRLVQLASLLLAARYHNATPLVYEVFRKAAHLDITQTDFAAAIQHLESYQFLEIQEDTTNRKPNASSALATCTSEAEQSRGRAEQSRASAAAPPGKRKVSRETDPDWLLDFKLAYPERAGDQGWRRAMRAGNARLAEGHTPAELIAGATRYAAFVDATGKRATEFVKQAATFLGPDKPFLLPWKPPPKPETDTERLLRLNSTHDDRVIEHEPETPALLVQH